MMRNKTLAVAIAAALSSTVILSASITSTVQAAATFENGNDTNDVTDCANAAAITANGCPIKAGDITGGGEEWRVDPTWGFIQSDPNDGLCFCSELFGSGASSTILPSGNGIGSAGNADGEGLGKYLTAVYNIDGDIDNTFLLTFTLSNGATFAAEPKLSVAGANNVASYNTPVNATELATGTNTAIFSVVAATNPLTTNERLMLAYRIQDADALATPGSKIELTATLQTDGLEVKVNPERTIPIAYSKQCLSVDLSQEQLGTVRIAVSEESKKFSGENPPGGEGAYVSDTEAVLGHIQINEVTGCKTSNGFEEWKLGKYTDTKVLSESSLLTISNGQFSASVNDPGDVFLEGVDVGSVTGTISATTITANEATWEITDQNLEDIANDTANTRDVQIRFKVDGDTEITSETDDNPTVSLTIDYEEESIVDLTVDPVELRRFRKDGTVCRVFGVPYSENALNQDSPAIHIINQSSDSGLVRVSLIGQDGNYLVGPNQVMNEGNNLGPYERLIIFIRDPRATPAEDFEDFMTDGIPPGGGRGWVEIASDLPDLDVYHVVRNTTTGIATNISTGVTGDGCVD